MSTASAALVVAVTSLQTVAQALVDNLPNEDSAATTADISTISGIVTNVLNILTPLAPAIAPAIAPAASTAI